MKNLLPALKRNSVRIIAVVALGLIVGCAALNGGNEHREASSVMDYLYPKNSLSHVDTPGVPVLSLPLRVGVAFVPERKNRSGNYFVTENERFTEKQKMALMKQVSDDFKKYPFVQSIQLIPSAYLTPQGGFDNLDQLRQMFSVDVIALLSYDQVQFTDEGFFSLTYVTVVGAWTVPGERNDTKTMMDTVVYDIASRKLLFRAPGISQVKASATPVNLSEELRDNSEEGFQRASTNMVANLQGELVQFKDRVKSSPEEFKVVTKPGYSGVGMGAVDAFDLALLSTMGAGFLALRKAKSRAISKTNLR
jgi:rhombotail lipoprotein